MRQTLQVDIFLDLCIFFLMKSIKPWSHSPQKRWQKDLLFISSVLITTNKYFRRKSKLNKCKYVLHQECRNAYRITGKKSFTFYYMTQLGFINMLEDQHTKIGKRAKWNIYFNPDIFWLTPLFLKILIELHSQMCCTQYSIH